MKLWEQDGYRKTSIWPKWWHLVLYELHKNDHKSKRMHEGHDLCFGLMTQILFHKLLLPQEGPIVRSLYWVSIPYKQLNWFSQRKMHRRLVFPVNEHSRRNSTVVNNCRQQLKAIHSIFFSRCFPFTVWIFFFVILFNIFFLSSFSANPLSNTHLAAFASFVLQTHNTFITFLTDNKSFTLLDYKVFLK